jgi:serine/threonine protein kinase
MKQICLHCTRAAPSGTLWCQELDCRTDDKPAVLEPGDTLGDLEILRVVAVLRTAAVYEALRSRQPVLLKVAHAGLHERLKREAGLLVEWDHRKMRHPALPSLLPAYGQTDVARYPYGKAVLRGDTFYYLVFRPLSGEPLNSLLLRNPQPWFLHAGWLVLACADALALMHAYGRLHLCLSPEAILVRYDRTGLPRPVLLDLGAVNGPGEADPAELRRCTRPAYRAPELLGPRGSGPSAMTDVHNLGLLLYEMLAGRPAYGNPPGGETRADTSRGLPRTLERPDLRGLPELAERAISPDPRRRPQQILDLARELQAHLPRLPGEKPARANWRVAAAVLSALMAVALLALLALVTLYG